MLKMKSLSLLNDMGNCGSSMGAIKDKSKNTIGFEVSRKCMEKFLVLLWFVGVIIAINLPLIAFPWSFLEQEIKGYFPEACLLDKS